MTPPDDGDDQGAGREAREKAGALVDLVQTTDLSLLAVLKTAHEGAGIPFAIQGEEGLHQIPIGRFGLGFFRRVIGAVIRVPADRADEAKAFLASFETDPPRIEEEWKDEDDVGDEETEGPRSGG